MDIIFVSIIAVLVASFIFVAFSFVKFLKDKSMPTFLMFSIAFGVFFTFFFGLVRTYFADAPQIDSFFWKLSGISSGITLSSFIVLASIWTFFNIKSSQSIVKTVALFYFIIYVLAFLLPEPERQLSLEGFVEWNTSFITSIVIYVGSLATLISCILSIYFGIQRKDKKPIIFGIGIFITMVGMILDGRGLVDYVYLYRLISMAGIILMSYSLTIKK